MNNRTEEKRRSHPLHRRYAGILLSMLLCIAMLPVGVFAEDDAIPDIADNAAEIDIEIDVDPDVVQQEADLSDAIDQAMEEETEEETPAATEPEPAPAPAPLRIIKAKTNFTLDGAKARINSAIVASDPLDQTGGPGLVWITAAKTSVKVSWTKAADPDIDGYIILRKAAKETVYTQLVTTKKTVSSYTDKKAKKKNTPYYYRVIGYKKTANGLRISSSINWAAGQTSNSKLKSVYSATLSKKTATLQKGETLKLTLKYAKPSTTFLPAKFQWVSSDTAIATVSSTGVITARDTGTVTISGIIASGKKFDCKVSIIAARKPAAPAAEFVDSDVDYIRIKWKKVAYATSYDVYRIAGEGESEKIGSTADLKFTDDNVLEGQEYSYQVIAVNENYDAVEYSSPSNIVTQAAVYKPLPVNKPVVKASLKYGKNDNGVILTWTPKDNDGVEKYEILKGNSKSTSNMSVVATVDGSKFTYTYIESKAGTHYYAVRAVGFNGTDQTSAVKSVKVLSANLLATKELVWTGTTNAKVTLYSDVKQNAKGTKVTGTAGAVGTLPKGTKVTCIGKAPTEIAKYHQPTWVQVTAKGMTGWLKYSQLSGGVKAVINIKKDYTRSVKEDYVNSMGYTSTTGYLEWLCVYTQRVYTFKGSKGKWSLVRSDRVTTGRFSHPTSGIDEAHRAANRGQIYKRSATVTMVQENGRSYYYKHASYFAPGISFHTGTWWSDTGKRRGSVTSAPNTYGCIRMYDSAAAYIYKKIPMHTSVVVTTKN